MDILAETERDREVLTIKINPNILSSSKDIPKGVPGDSAWQKAQRGRQLRNSSAVSVALVCLLKQTTMN